MTRTVTRRPLKACLTAVLALLATSIVTLPPATAAELGIQLVRLRQSSVDLSVVCPVDPPTTVLVYTGQPARSLGRKSIDCIGGGVAQAVTVPFDRVLTAGQHVYLSATVSGDSGEINAWFPNALVGPDPGTPPPPPPTVSAPSAPWGLRVTRCPYRVVLSWRVPRTNGGAPLDSYRASRRGVHVIVPASVRTRTFKGLTPRRSYRFAVAAHNAAGYSRSAVAWVRTPAVWRGCRPTVRR
jgi:hypothetical protein